MTEHRPFPPSPRRRALARQTGLHAATPLLVGAAAGAAILVALGAVAASAVHRLGVALAIACGGRASPPGAPDAPVTASRAAALSPGDLPQAVLAFALPIAGAAALAALAAHIVQTRAVWLPRRRIAGAPAHASGPGRSTRRAAGELAAAAAIGGVAFGWLWRTAPRLADLLTLEPVASSSGARLAGADASLSAAAPKVAAMSRLFAGAASLLVGAGAALVVAWVALGVLDAVARRVALERALAMTPSEKRDDDRLASADPRWQAQRAAARRDADPSDAIAAASFLVLGDDAAVAVAWQHRLIPVRTAAGRGPRATQLLGLARRHRIAVQRDAALTAALVDDDGPIAERHWPRLAEIAAATHARNRTV